jgi:hypothetical protein
MTGVEMIKLLKKHKILPFKIGKSSHYHYNVNGCFFQVAHHRAEMGKGITDDILKKAGLKGAD